MIRKEKKQKRDDDGGRGGGEGLKRKQEKNRKKGSAGRRTIQGAVRERRNLALGGAATPEFRDSESGWRAAMPKIIGTDVRYKPTVG